MTHAHPTAHEKAAEKAADKAEAKAEAAAEKAAAAAPVALKATEAPMPPPVTEPAHIASALVEVQKIDTSGPQTQITFVATLPPGMPAGVFAGGKRYWAHFHSAP